MRNSAIPELCHNNCAFAVMQLLQRNIANMQSFHLKVDSKTTGMVQVVRLLKFLKLNQIDKIMTTKCR